MANIIYSSCCGAEIKNTDYDLCPECGEHTGFEDEEGYEIDQPLIDDGIKRATEKMFGRGLFGSKV